MPKYGAYPLGSTPDGTEEYLVKQNGATVRLTGSQQSSYLSHHHLDVTVWADLGATSSAWNVTKANGTAVSTTGTTTQGLQEAITASHTGLGTAGSDLDIHGGDLATGGAQVVNTSSTINIPVTQGKRTRIGAVTLNFGGGGAGAGLQFDSQEMAHWSLEGGQVVYGRTGSPVLFKPTNGTPLDGLKGIVDSHFSFTTTGPVAFDFSGHANAFATNSTYELGELNYANAINGTSTNAAFFVPSVAAGQNFSNNFFFSHHVHDVPTGKTAWLVGNGAPSGSQVFGQNFNFLHLSGTAPYNGLDTYESGSFYLVTIANVGAGTPIKFRSGANNNVIIAPHYDNATTAVSDSGTGNIIIGNGAIALGSGASVSGLGTASLAKFTSSGLGAGTSSGFLVQGAGQVSYGWNDTAAGANQGIWDAAVTSATSLQFRTVNDANSAANAWLQVTRSGITISSVQIGNGTTFATVPIAANDTLVGKATTDTLTNKTYDTAGSGNSFSINGLAATANTGTGAVVRAASPTITGTLAAPIVTATGSISASGSDGDFSAGGNRAFMDTGGGNARIGSLNGGGSAIGLLLLANGATVLTFTSGGLGTFASALTASSYIPNSSTVPSNGMYLPAANTLGWAINSAAELQLTSTALSPAVDGGNSLGTTALGWQNLFANTGFVLNIENSDWVATHTAGILTVGTGDLRVTTAGTNAASVVTVNGTQTLANKSLTAPALGTPASGVLTNATGYTVANLADSAYTAWVPTVTSQVGTITTLGTVTARYKQVGKTIFFYINIPITTNGTGAGYVQATLPTASANTANQSAVGRENGLTGKNLGARIVLNSTSLQFTFYDGTYPGADGAAIGASGFYEVP